MRSSARRLRVAAIALTLDGMTDGRTVDVLVVGAGPVGLTMAWSLGHRGLACRIVDRAPEPTQTSKALVLWSRTLELLETMGGAAPFVAEGMRATGASINAEGRQLVHVDLGVVDSPYPYACMIPQSATERLLAAQVEATGVTVERRVELVDFTSDADGVTATLRHDGGRDETVRCAWLVGCDGAHSTVRHVLGLPFEGAPEPSDWILADVHVDAGVPPNEVTVHFSPGGMLVFFPIEPGRFRVVADLGRARSDGHPPAPTLAEVQAVVDARGPGGIRLGTPIWLAGFRIHERKVRDYGRGRVFLCGDAAHIHSPAGGQGMNTGMQDALNLAWKLALAHAGRARPLLLDSYSIERSAVGEAVLRQAGFITRAATLRHPLARWARDRAYAVAGTFAPVRALVASRLTELAIAYPTSPVSGGSGGAVAPGARCPVRPLQAADGTTTTILGLLGDGRFQLLALGGADVPADVASRFAGLVTPHAVATAPQPGALVDAGGAFHRALGVTEPTLVLVRPDGYVAWRGRPLNAPRLQAHLDALVVADAAARTPAGSQAA
jgi:2-polyprenyl-6-methoxyphenol hydroxylase-like FAD-dependent oxidoreductase